VAQQKAAKMMSAEDDEFSEWLRAAESLVLRRATESLEGSLANARAPQADCPSPLDWHPAYADKTGLVDWLNGVGPYGDRYDILLPKPLSRRFVAMQADDIAAVDVATRHARLTKQRCYGFAPYVGRPFIYTWFAAVDELGRAIAGESTIEYLPDSS
jgi:hypothetical protein